MPMGTWQPPPSAARAARSAVTAKRVAGSSRKAMAAMVSASSLRVSMPSEPWPAAGQKCLWLETFANPFGFLEAIEAGGG